MSIALAPVQKHLFAPPGTRLLDATGYLSKDAVRQFKAIRTALKDKGETLEDITQISRDSWSNWLCRRRRPADATIAFLTVLMMHPQLVLGTLRTHVYAYPSATKQ